MSKVNKEFRRSINELEGVQREMRGAAEGVRVRTIIDRVQRKGDRDATTIPTIPTTPTTPTTPIPKPQSTTYTSTSTSTLSDPPPPSHHVTTSAVFEAASLIRDTDISPFSARAEGEGADHAQRISDVIREDLVREHFARGKEKGKDPV